MASFTVSSQGAIPPFAARPSAKALTADSQSLQLLHKQNSRCFEESLLFCCLLFDMDGIELGDQAASIHTSPIAAEGIRGLLPKQRFLSVKEHCDN